ncbi:hypothetical protein Micbo1qcDRAFT_162658 [Microdochium bolleyi]|uniref:Atos-like conserved domain-containing protein n=1 Tax=Microdochium bolleyi TaxID=196109 RepID=A0A136J5B8_9PEZI|nr:hypothetical protein Micbo1qcDRAFT_162658 [Microdochium bolleyi]
MPFFSPEAPSATGDNAVSDRHKLTTELPLTSLDPQGTRTMASNARRPPPHRRTSEESLPVDLCEGLVLDCPQQLKTPAGDKAEDVPARTELIERLKRSQSPVWQPHYDTAWNQPSISPKPNRTPEKRPMSPSLLLPITITPEKGRTVALSQESLEAEAKLEYGLSIERPRSALHSGDFTQDNRPSHRSREDWNNRSRPGTTIDHFGNHGGSWLATSPPRNFTPFQSERRQPTLAGQSQPSALSKSLSSSISSSFAYQPPTSPLVQSESNDEVEFSASSAGIDIGSGFSRANRRHTLMSTHSGSFYFSPSPSPRHPPALRQERSFPYQAHQPRRSLTSTPNFLPHEHSRHTPSFSRSRRPSFGSEASPIQHASMVGSYEESILRGRMSTTPSKPLEFVAQIGVLGLGKCKPNLRCPPHVTLPFPAVFYSYATSAYGRSEAEDGPSPYVGQIDLENGLPNQEGNARAKRKIQSRTAERKASTEDGGERVDCVRADGSDVEARRSQRQKRRSGSPRAPPGGSYRIPEKGQVQIIIKNPNKTAVKLFLVPYDLAGMEPGTKTFIRQRSYSAGPIIENMPATANTGSTERPTLRYLVHLHICCPSMGRFYLYKSIRVVFANRVPDGKERLRNEISTPEPKFSSYKPIRVMHPPTTGGSGPAANMAAEKAFRRRSSGYYAGLGTSSAYGTMDGIVTPIQSQSNFSYRFGNNTPVQPVPFSLPSKGSATSVSGRRVVGEDILAQSPGSSRPTTQDTNSDDTWDGVEQYNKLSPGDAGYGGNAFSGLINGSPAVAESLLSQRLRTLGVQGLDQANSRTEGEREIDAVDRD